MIFSVGGCFLVNRDVWDARTCFHSDGGYANRLVGRDYWPKWYEALGYGGATDVR